MPIAFRIEAATDDPSFKRAAQRAEDYFSTAGKAASGSFTKAFSGGAKDMSKAVDGYAKSLDSVADSAGKANVAEKTRQQVLERSKSAAKRAEDAEEKLKAARDAGDTKAVTAAEKELDRAREQQARTTAAVVRSSEAVSRARRQEQRDLREAVSSYRNLQQAQAVAATPARQPGFLSGMTSQSSGIVGQFSALGGMSGKAFVGGAAAAMAAVALVAAGAKAAGLVLDGFKSVMETGIDFSKTVNNFQGVTGSTSVQTQQMSAAARALGADTTLAGVSASDAARAMTELAKAGFTVDDAISSARGTMQLATAAQMDAAKAAEVQANAINAFGLSAGDAAHVADVLANAANASSADMPNLALALQQVGGIARGFGEDIEGTVSALGMLANAGIKGSDAGTLLKTTLQSITDQGNPAQGAIQALGMSLYDFGTGQFVGFRELFRQLDEAKRRMSPEQFQAETNILFGSDAMRSAMLGSAASFDQMEASIGRVGTASSMAKAQMAGWPGVMEGISNTTEALKLSFYDVFNTAAGQQVGQKLVEGLGGVVDWVNTHKPEIMAFVAGVGSATATVADRMMGLAQAWLNVTSAVSDGLAYTLGIAIEGLMKLGNITGTVLSKIPGFKGIGESIRDATQGVDDFVDGWQNAGNQMRSAAGGLGVLRGGLLELRDGFTASMADAIASEEANRQFAASFKEVKSGIDQIPNTHEFVIKENSAEIKTQLEKLGFAVQNLPDGRQVIRVDYRDSAGNPLSPAMVSQMMGFDTQSFASAGDAQRARRGLPYAAPGDTPTATPAPVPYGPAAPWTPSTATPGSAGSSGPKLPDAPVVPLAAMPGLLPGVPMSAQIYSAQSAVSEAQTKVAEKEARLNQLLASNTATASDILNARNDLEQASRAADEAQMRFTEAQTGTFEKQTRQLDGMSKDLGQIGASIDQDFGISKGLAGIAENITKFIANLAAAPLLGTLSAISNAAPTQGGHGLMGILGARGMFGAQYQNNQYAGGYSSVAAATGVPMYSGGNVAAMLNLAQSASGRTAYAPASDLVNGLADCSGSVSDLYEVLRDGQPNPGRAFTTTNFATDAEAAKLGFLPGYMPGAFNVGVNPYPGQSGHMAATLPNGVNFEGGGATGGGAQYGGGAAGALSSQFAKRYYMPIGGSPAVTPMPASAAATYAPLTPTQLTIPALTTPTPAAGGVGMGVGPGFAPAPSALPDQPGTRIGGLAPPSGTGRGGVGIQSGGMIDMAIQAGGAGLDMLAPGAGQAAQMGIKLGTRAVEYAGQAAGIGVQGLMETFLPTGGSELANSNWITRIAGGIAGAAPALPNMAGGGQGGGQLESPNGGQQAQGQGGQPGLNIEKLEYTNQNATEDRAGKDLTYHLGSMYAAPGM